MIKIGLVLSLQDSNTHFDTLSRFYCASDGEHRLNMLVFQFFGRPGVIEEDYCADWTQHLNATPCPPSAAVQSEPAMLERVCRPRVGRGVEAKTRERRDQLEFRSARGKRATTAAGCWRSI